MEERADIMTDYQMKTLMNLVISIVQDAKKSNSPLEEIEEKLIEIRDGEFAKKKGKKEPEI